MTGQNCENADTERAIAACVHIFYAKVWQDPDLGPIFNAHVHDWDVHMHTISNFWSKVLLKTQRYSGSPYVAHVNLPIQPQHIARWLELFTEAVHETLPGSGGEIILAKARMMGESFVMGLFPFTDKDGNPSRHPA
jgi:hemoglobin